jgi:hypothetical protein
MSEPSVIEVSWPPLALGDAGWHCRDTFRPLKACISAVDQRLMGE